MTVYAAFSDWLFHLVRGIPDSSIALRGLAVHFLLGLNNIPLSGYPQFIYPFTC